jgi:1-phosphatidylinositol-4-phosphate 5-kinase
MEVRRAILLAQRQHQSTIGTTGAGDNSSTAPQRDRRGSLTNKSERGLSRRTNSRERAAAKERNHSRPSPLHTLESSNLPEEDPLPSDRSGFIFYSDDGGYKATDDLGGPWHGGLGGRLVIDGKIISDEEALEKGKGRGETDGEGVVYYLGVIDILTRWTFVKKVEHFWKGLKADRVSLIVGECLISG